jgi:hypothetical protein
MSIACAIRRDAMRTGELRTLRSGLTLRNNFFRGRARITRIVNPNWD